MLGLSNTAGVLAGVFGTAATGYILQRGKQTIHPLHEKKYELLLYWCHFHQGFHHLWGPNGPKGAVLMTVVLVQWEQRNNLPPKICFSYELFVSAHVFFPTLFSIGSWDDVFKVAVVLYIIGTLVWNLFSTGEKILE